MAKAVWNGVVLAESDNCRIVEGNYYFPVDSVHTEYLKPSETHTTCPWKGLASYYNVEVNGTANPDAAWYYLEPKSSAQKIKDYVAFWRGIKVEP